MSKIDHYDLDYQRKLAKLQKKLYRLSHKYIRLRDPFCITCEKPTVHAGHFIHNRTIIDYDPRNLNGQCYTCNVWKSGNHDAYRIKLIERIGIANVEWLESAKDVIFRPSVEWYEGLIAWYTKKLKEVI